MISVEHIEPRSIYTLKEAAKICGKPYGSLYKHHRAGRLKLVREKYTESLYVRGDELIRFIGEMFEDVA